MKNIFDDLDDVKKDIDNQRESLNAKPRVSANDRDFERMQVVKLYLRGLSYVQIAAKLGLNPSKVGSHVRKAKELWRKTTIEDINSVKNQHLAEIEAIKDEMWDAYEKSKRIKKIRTKRGAVVNGNLSNGANASLRPTSVETIEEEILGDMEFMKGVMWAMSERAKLLNLYQASKSDELASARHLDATNARNELLTLISDVAKRSSGQEQKMLNPATTEQDYIDADIDNDDNSQIEPVVEEADEKPIYQIIKEKDPIARNSVLGAESSEISGTAQDNVKVSDFLSKKVRQIDKMVDMANFGSKIPSAVIKLKSKK